MNEADTALRDAILVDDLTKANDALSAGAHLDGTGSIKFPPPLLFAAEHERLSIMAHLLVAGADIEARGEGDETPLMAAVWSGKRASVDLLIEHGADVNAPDGDGRTPLYAAASRVSTGHHHPDEVAIGLQLLRAGADGNLLCHLTGKSAFAMCPDWLRLAAQDRADAELITLRTVIRPGADDEGGGRL